MDMGSKQAHLNINEDWANKLTKLEVSDYINKRGVISSY